MDINNITSITNPIINRKIVHIHIQVPMIQVFQYHLVFLKCYKSVEVQVLSKDVLQRY